MFSRSMSMTEGDSKSQDLLRHIMSSGSMVEDIERQHRRQPSPKGPSAPQLQKLPQNFKSSQKVALSDKIPEKEPNEAPVNAKFDLSPYLKMNEKGPEAGGVEDKVKRRSPNVQETEGKESLLTPGALQTSFSLGAEVVY